ncbi:hypothetical protein ACQPZP_00850 [Spirillospora sp. CA-142024]|uniref:hypothetical protein n=1 Tax=Spirillospora sp. CA-142024 TaxID=3240036 RepID=UPI003D8D9448
MTRPKYHINPAKKDDPKWEGDRARHIADRELKTTDVIKGGNGGEKVGEVKPGADRDATAEQMKGYIED